ncbi:MAG: hypothetical protein ACO1OQ_01880 [Rufibacter sp.]
MKKLFTLLLLVFVFTVGAQAQDIIVKVDKTEIKAKVLEIDETHIKYKQWEFLDGPTYSVRKNEVFMVIYKNGKRETFEQTAPVQQARPQQQYNAPASQPAMAGAILGSGPDTTPTSSEANPKLSILRTSVDMDALSNDYFSLRAEAETPLFKNRYFYWGFLVAASSYVGPADIDASSYVLGLSATARVPLNYITTKDTTLPLTGFVPYAKVYYSTDFEFGGFNFDTGIDWLFIKTKTGTSIGVSAFTTEFVSYSLGISFTGH